MESILEAHRGHHEERERLEYAMVRELIAKRSTHREHINSDHRVKYLLDKYVDATGKIKELYEDKAGARKAEINAISASNEFNEFYSRLRTIKEFYKTHPNEVAIPIASELEKFVENRDSEVALVDFTDEESYGKFLDLNVHFHEYLNLKQIVGANAPKVDYLSYLNTFDHFYVIPKAKKFSADYQKYLEGLLEYLEGYIVRVKPLMPLNDIITKLKDDFEQMWETGKVPGWPKETTGALSNTGAALDLSAFSSREELASLGLDRLKSALVALGLKCGGSLEERAERLWKTKGKTADEIEPSLFAKKKGGIFSDVAKQKAIAFMEVQIYKYIDILDEQRQTTKENVQRKQARTAGEREESDEEVEDSDSEEDEESDVIYNPKNLPLGWDGKPIPYWLYKLHGLNISYVCEICGNAQYKGPKAFQKHFAEWRHAHGMRCLGIPNTAHFANITKIEDALALWEKLKSEKHKEKFQASNEEEYEDNAGNVVTKKTYEDLKRQGLL